MRRLFVLVASIAFVDMLFHAALSPLLPHYSEELGLSKGAAGVLSAAYAAGTLAGTLPAIWLAKRLGARRMVLAGLVLVGASTLLFAFAKALVWLDLARFVQGIGGACTWIGALSWLMLEAKSKRRGELIGGVIAGAVAGELVGPIVGSAATLSSPDVVFSLLAALVALLLWAAWATPAATSRRPVDLAALGRLDRERGRILVGWWLVTLPAVFAACSPFSGPSAWMSSESAVPRSARYGWSRPGRRPSSAL